MDDEDVHTRTTPTSISQHDQILEHEIEAKRCQNYEQVLQQLETCNKIHCTERPNTELTSLSLCAGASGDLGSIRMMELLSKTLPVCPSLEYLYIHGGGVRRIGAKVSKALQATLTGCTSLRTLRASQFPGTHCIPIAQHVAKTSSLTALNLKSCEMGLQGGMAVAKMVSKNRSLRRLTLDFCLIQLPACAEIGKSLGKNTTLEYLSMASCVYPDIKQGRLPTAAAYTWTNFDAFTQGLRHNSTLKTIILSSNYLYCKGVCALMDALQGNTTLENLSLARCQIAGPGGKAVAEWLQCNTTLRRLNLAVNHIGDEGATAMAKALGCNSTLQLLQLGCRDFSPTGAEVFAESGLRNNSSLTALDLAGLSGGASGIILRQLCSNTTLEYLNISSFQEIVDEHLGPLVHFLQTNRTLKHLNIEKCVYSGLNANFPSTTSYESVCDALAANTSLRGLRISSDKEQTDILLAEMLMKNTCLLSLTVESSQNIHHLHTLAAIRSHPTLQSAKFLRMSETFCLPEVYDKKCALIAGIVRDNVHIKELVTGPSSDFDVYGPAKAQKDGRNGGIQIGKALLDVPRYHTLNLDLHDMHMWPEAVSLGLPEWDKYHNKITWSDDNVQRYIRCLHLDKILAFVMCQHARLGEDSWTRHLTAELLRAIVWCYFSMPLDYMFDPSAVEDASFWDMMRMPALYKHGGLFADS
jgi:hypothetical protein